MLCSPDPNLGQIPLCVLVFFLLPASGGCVERGKSALIFLLLKAISSSRVSPLYCFVLFEDSCIYTILFDAKRKITVGTWPTFFVDEIQDSCDYISIAYFEHASSDLLKSLSREYGLDCMPANESAVIMYSYGKEGVQYELSTCR